MSFLVHVIILLVAIAAIWFFAGVLIDAVGRIAKRSCRSGFITAFFLLGFLTSISEISVAINAGISKVPGVSVGNLIGASFVLMLFVVPLLAITGKGIRINQGLSKTTLFLTLLAIVLPALLTIDGNVTKTEGLLALLMYGTVAYALYRSRAEVRACDVATDPPLARIRNIVAEGGRVVVGALAIFAASHFLVEEAVYLGQALSIPASLVGLLVLSLGTNIPEIVIALRAIFSKKIDVAFGDYLGSASMNTFIFGALALGTGAFVLEASEFLMTAGLLAVGTIFLYFFARSKLTISRREGVLLISFYVLFVALQFLNVVRFAGN